MKRSLLDAFRRGDSDTFLEVLHQQEEEEERSIKNQKGDSFGSLNEHSLLYPLRSLALGDSVLNHLFKRIDVLQLLELSRHFFIVYHVLQQDQFWMIKLRYDYEPIIATGTPMAFKRDWKSIYIHCHRVIFNRLLYQYRKYIEKTTSVFEVMIEPNKRFISDCGPLIKIQCPTRCIRGLKNSAGNEVSLIRLEAMPLSIKRFFNIDVDAFSTICHVYSVQSLLDIPHATLV